jgi:hypothetical protein
MTFLQPFVLWGLPLILLPILIHLLNRMRHRPQPWAAMRFLISATRSSINNARLREWLILLFRVLAVLMLVLFVGRPLAGGWLGWALAPAPDTVLILLDRSASMEMQVPGTTNTKRELALRALADAAKPFEESSHLVLIDSALRAPQEIGRAASLTDLSLTAATDTAADIPGLLSAAVTWLVENRAGTAEIWIASDLQRSNWQPEDTRWQSLIAQLNGFPQKVRVRLLAMNQRGELNRSLALREVLRQKRGAQGELQFTLDLQASNADRETVPLVRVLDGTRTVTDLKLDAQSLRWRSKAPLNNQATNGWGSFELPADANGRDNKIYFVYGAETPLRASVISTDTVGARLLQLAIGAADKTGRSVADLATPTTLDRTAWEQNTFVVWQEALPTGAIAQRLRTFAEQGGTILFLPTGTTDPQRFEGLGWGDVQQTDSQQPFRIRRWNEEEGPLAKTDEGLSLPVADVVFVRRQTIFGQKGVLAAFEDGAPFLARQNIGRGEVFFCGSLPHRDWSSLSDGPVLVPMMQRLLQSGSRRLHRADSVACGELSSVDQARRWEAVDSTSTKEIRTDAGVYRAGDRLLAVNRPAAEDDLEILEAADAQRLFGSVGLQLLADRKSERGNLQGEIWRFFLGAMLLFLVAEAILTLPPRRPASVANGPLIPKEEAEVPA